MAIKVNDSFGEEINGSHVGLDEDGYKKFNELFNLLKERECFECEGITFEGNSVEVVKRYIGLNPSKKFFIWLQDTIPMLIHQQ